MRAVHHSYKLVCGGENIARREISDTYSPGVLISRSSVSWKGTVLTTTVQAEGNGGLCLRGLA